MATGAAEDVLAARCGRGCLGRGRVVDGQDGTEKVIVAELIGVATEEKMGLVSPCMAKFLKWQDENLNTDAENTIVRIFTSGKFSFLFSNTHNSTNPSLYLVGFGDGVKYKIYHIAGVKDEFYVSDNYLFIENKSVWSSFAIIPLTGTVNEVMLLSEVPAGATPLNIL